MGDLLRPAPAERGATEPCAQRAERAGADEWIHAARASGGGAGGEGEGKSKSEAFFVCWLRRFMEFEVYIYQCYQR